MNNLSECVWGEVQCDEVVVEDEKEEDRARSCNECGQKNRIGKLSAGAFDELGK